MFDELMIDDIKHMGETKDIGRDRGAYNGVDAGYADMILEGRSFSTSTVSAPEGETD